MFRQPIGMIFAPSRDGISRASEALTASEDLARGANVFSDTGLAF